MYLPKFCKRFLLLNPPRLAIWAVAPVIVLFSGTLAFLLRFDFVLNDKTLWQLAWAITVWLLVKPVVFSVTDVNRGSWKYASVSDVLRIGCANLIACCTAVPLIIHFAPTTVPPSVFIIDFLLCTSALTGTRLIARAGWHYSFEVGPRCGKRTVVYGAGDAGVTLLAELRKNSRLGYDVCGFIDDDPRKVGTHIHTTPILGAGSDLSAIAARHSIQDVLVAIPSADRVAMATILKHCQNAGLRCKTIPGLSEIIETGALGPQIRDVSLHDLLGRIPVHLDETAISAKLEGCVVMVTGAAGSIGSELCRQIARFRPRSIVGYEVAETPLFDIDREMHESFPDITFIPELGSIQSRCRMTEVMERHSPSVLYHAAAYKHVPMMEAHLFEAVENNILGTENVALVAAEHGIADFVMISSDKAVRPTNIMGATKRFAELVINSLQGETTKYVSVRFGNVLGSNGSVIPIFKRQIAAGGPLTVTHPEMCRYFMTIPEAAQLVLQAFTMGKGGEIFVLDMGQPVKIVDLARNLILLSGLRPDEDIHITFTGMRPGEKLYEELSTLQEGTVPTFHEKIKIFSGAVPPRGHMEDRITTLRHLCVARDYRGLLLEIKETVPEYNPSSDVLRRMLETVSKPKSATPARFLAFDPSNWDMSRKNG